MLLHRAHNFQFQAGALILALVIGGGVYFQIDKMEWMMIVLVSGLVIVAEAINTAFEIDINLTSPEYHTLARDVKDVAAGAVLLAVITSVIIGLIIFLPYIF